MTTASIIEIRRSFHAPIDRVFATFADPAVLRAWAAPNEHTNEWVELDFRVGGRYRRGMRFPDGTLRVLTGVYSEINPPSRLRYSFAWETIPELGSSEVTIELNAEGDTTCVVVRHEGLPAEAAAGFDTGWIQCLQKLSRVLETTNA